MLVSFILVLKPISSFAEDEKSPEEYWAETGLSLQTVEKLYLNNENCYKSEANFSACMITIDEFGQRGWPEIMVKSVNSWKKDAILQKHAHILQTYGPVVIVQVDDDFMSEDDLYKIELEREALESSSSQEKKTAQQIYSLLHQERVTRSESLRGLYKESQSQKIDFDSVLSYVSSYVMANPGEASYVAGMLLNRYIGLAKDPHSRFAPKSENEKQMSSHGEEFYGIGAMVSIHKSEGIYGIQITPMEDSPADKAKLKKNDIITEIDGVSVRAIGDINDVVKKLKGPEGTSVQVKIFRKGEYLPQPIVVVRGKVETKVVSYRPLNSQGNIYGYIKLSQFTSGVCELVEKEINGHEKEVSAWVLDLRDDPGGYMHEATCIAGLFLSPDVVMKKESEFTLWVNGRISDSKGFWSVPVKTGKTILVVKNFEGTAFQPIPTKKMQVTRLPMVTLINGGSASASEILSGALQDYQRSWILGDRSFGKGTAQTVIDWSENPKITSIMTDLVFYQPSGRTNQIVGIIPDFKVPSSPEATEEDDFSAREENLYENYVAAPKKAWVSPRPEAQQKMENCMNSEGQAEKLYSKAQEEGTNGIQGDYRVLKAADALNCELKYNGGSGIDKQGFEESLR